LDKDSLKSDVKHLISSSIFGSISITSILGSLLSFIKLSKSKLNTLDDLYTKEATLKIYRSNEIWNIEQDFDVNKEEVSNGIKAEIEEKLKKELAKKTPRSDIFEKI
ncbi:1092_t:CDS:2, partial [Dentiscutata heterogama]